MELKRENLQKYEDWYQLAISLPGFSVPKILEETKKAPSWIHFGGTDLFRAVLATMQQRLLNKELSQTGIVLVDRKEVLEKLYLPHDKLSLSVTCHGDGVRTTEVIASVAYVFDDQNLPGLQGIFAQDSLSFLSLTIGKEYYAWEKESMEKLFPMKKPNHPLGLLATLLYHHFKEQGTALTIATLDDLPKNGITLRNALMEIAQFWLEQEQVTQEFLDYLENAILYPCSVLDKFVPPPSEAIKNCPEVKALNLSTKTVQEEERAAFFNTERPQYLFFENKFHENCPPLDKAGAFYVKRRDLRLVDALKNNYVWGPLEVSTFLFSQLLELSSMSEILESRDLLTLLQELLYEEGQAVMPEIKIFHAEEYIDEILQVRLKNPLWNVNPKIYGENLSQKIPLSLGVILKRYRLDEKDTSSLVALPLVIAAWFRYLLGVSDQGKVYFCAPDPMLEALQQDLKTVSFGKPETYQGQLGPYLRDRRLFGANLENIGLANAVEANFQKMILHNGAVKDRLLDEMNPFAVF